MTFITYLAQRNTVRALVNEITTHTNRVDRRRQLSPNNRSARLGLKSKFAFSGFLSISARP